MLCKRHKIACRPSECRYMRAQQLRADTDATLDRAAEAHRVEHSHTVYVRHGHGWVCEVCDADIVESFIAGQEV